MTPAVAVPAPPSSLTKLRSPAHCPECGSSRLTEIRMTLTDGSPVRFASCHDCEHRLWSQEGSDLALPVVLAKATRRR